MIPLTLGCALTREGDNMATAKEDVEKEIDDEEEGQEAHD